jgi:uncharacterized membrane protein YesL
VEEKTIKFNKFEKIFFRINLAIFTLSVSLYALFAALIEDLGPFVDLIMSGLLFGIVTTTVIFGLSIIHIIKYIVNHRTAKEASIWRSIINLILSPLSFFIITFFIFLTSAVSCSYVG